MSNLQAYYELLKTKPAALEQWHFIGTPLRYESESGQGYPIVRRGITRTHLNHLADAQAEIEILKGFGAYTGDTYDRAAGVYTIAFSETWDVPEYQALSIADPLSTDPAVVVTFTHDGVTHHVRICEDYRVASGVRTWLQNFAAEKFSHFVEGATPIERYSDDSWWDNPANRDLFKATLALWLSGDKVFDKQFEEYLTLNFRWEAFDAGDNLLAEAPALNTPLSFAVAANLPDWAALISLV